MLSIVATYYNMVIDVMHKAGAHGKCVKLSLWTLCIQMESKTFNTYVHHVVYNFQVPSDLSGVLAANIIYC